MKNQKRKNNNPDFNFDFLFFELYLPFGPE